MYLTIFQLLLSIQSTQNEFQLRVKAWSIFKEDGQKSTTPQNLQMWQSTRRDSRETRLLDLQQQFRILPKEPLNVLDRTTRTTCLRNTLLESLLLIFKQKQFLQRQWCCSRIQIKLKDPFLKFHGTQTILQMQELLYATQYYDSNRWAVRCLSSPTYGIWTTQMFLRKLYFLPLPFVLQFSIQKQQIQL